jgi:hypothetical protein
MTKYRKMPVEIDAVQWDGNNFGDVFAFVNEDDRWKEGVDDGYVGGPGIGHTPTLGTLDIPTLEGTMTVQAGGWIIRGVKGELYPCKPDIFDATYEQVTIEPGDVLNDPEQSLSVTREGSDAAAGIPDGSERHQSQNPVEVEPC